VDQLGAALGTHKCRQAQLPTDDGGMAGPATPVGDDRGRLLHRRFPVGVGLVGHENLALAKLVEILHVLDDPGRSPADLLTNTSAADKHSPS